MLVPMPGDIWRHYKKGDLCEIVTLARFEFGHELAVVYRELDNGAVWIRSLNKFVGLVKHEQNSVLRFEKVTPR